MIYNKVVLVVKLWNVVNLLVVDFADIYNKDDYTQQSNDCEPEWGRAKNPKRNEEVHPVYVVTWRKGIGEYLRTQAAAEWKVSAKIREKIM